MKGSCLFVKGVPLSRVAVYFFHCGPVSPQAALSWSGRIYECVAVPLWFPGHRLSRCFRFNCPSRVTPPSGNLSAWSRSSSVFPAERVPKRCCGRRTRGVCIAHAGGHFMESLPSSTFAQDSRPLGEHVPELVSQ